MSDQSTHLEILFLEICNGYSHCQVKIPDIVDIYYRHPLHSELFELERNKDKFRATLPESLLTKEDALNLIIEQGWWPRENEERLRIEQDFIRRIEETEKLVPLEKDKKEQRKIKLSHQKIVNELLQTRASFLPLQTVETFLAKRINELCLINFFYSNKELSKPLFTQEEYDELPPEAINILQLEYYNLLNCFQHNNIRKLACGAFFQNLLYISGDIAKDFFGVPTVKLTKYQYELFLSGRHFKTILTNCAQMDKNIPNEKMGDPDAMEKWHEMQLNIYNNKHKKGAKYNETSGTSMIGATQEENRAMYGKEANSGGLLSAAKNAGGKLDFKGIMQKRGK